MGGLAYAWGILGVLALLSQALWRLYPLAWQAIDDGLTGLQWALLVGWVVMMAHAEGYRGFHRKFSPRVVARAMWLRDNPRPLFVAFAPLFCMNLFHASKRGRWTSRLVVLGIIGLIVAVRSLSQPWRGIVDAGVVVGLTIGVGSILYYLARALSGTPPPIEPDIPESAESARA